MAVDKKVKFEAAIGFVHARVAAFWANLRSDLMTDLRSTDDNTISLHRISFFSFNYCMINTL